MGRHSHSLWPEWLAELPAPVFYRDHGTLLLWHPEDAGEAGRAFKMIASCRSHPGIKRLGHSRIGHLEPALGARISEALYIPGEAQLDNRAFLRAVAIAVEEAGVECHWEIDSLVKELTYGRGAPLDVPESYCLTYGRFLALIRAAY